MTDMTEMLYVEAKTPVMDGLMKDYPFVKAKMPAMLAVGPSGRTDG